MNAILFYTFASIAVISALMVITRRNPLMSALMLVSCFLATAIIFALLDATFLAVLQILIYAGAIMVLFIFVIMLVHTDNKFLKIRTITFSKTLGTMAVIYMVIVLCIAVWVPPFVKAPDSGISFTATQSIGRSLVTTYAIPFELLSVLLLVAIIGAILLSKKEV